MLLLWLLLTLSVLNWSSVDAQYLCQSSNLELLLPDAPQVESITGSGSGTAKCFLFNDTSPLDDIAIELSVNSGGAMAYIRQMSFVSNDWQLSAFNGSTDWLVVRSGDPLRLGGPLLVILFGTTIGDNKFQLRVFQNPSSNATTDPAVLNGFAQLKARCCNLEACGESWWGGTGPPDPCLFPGTFCQGNPRQLKQLTLNKVFACDIPLDIISQFTSLEMLEMRNNDFSTTAQVNWTAIASLPNLKYLDLYGNKLQGNISCVLKSSNLTYINFMQNQFVGDWPSCLLSKDDLSVLRVGHNSLTGELRDSDVSLTSQLQWLGVQGLKLGGVIPPRFASLKSLTALDLTGNTLSGQIPAEFKQMGLRKFMVDDNQLSGPFPDFLQAMPNIETLSLSYNDMGSSIPDSFTKLPKLASFQCQSCGLLGSLPQDWSIMSSLTVLNLATNKLNGSLPSSLFDMPLLSILDSSDNSFTGPLPEVPSSSMMYYFNGSHNGFTGRIPESFANMPLTNFYQFLVADSIVMPTLLDLSYNHLSGPVPSVMNASSQAEFSFEGNDGLTCVGDSFAGLVCSGPSSSTAGSAGGSADYNRVAIIVAITAAVVIGFALSAAVAFVLFRWHQQRPGSATSFKRFQPELPSTAHAPADPSPL